MITYYSIQDMYHYDTYKWSEDLLVFNLTRFPPFRGIVRVLTLILALIAGTWMFHKMDIFHFLIMIDYVCIV
jgi:hypothetical protein